MIKYIYSALAVIILFLPSEVFSQDIQMNKLMMGANAGFISQDRNGDIVTIKGTVGQVAASMENENNQQWFAGYWGPSFLSFVSVENEVDGMGKSVTNYPNPATNFTTINFELDASSYVSLKVYDINGNEVMSISDRLMSQGINQIEWDTRASDGQPVAAGTYLYEVQVKSVGSTKQENYVMRNIMVINR